MSIKDRIRALQVHFPGLLETKCRMQRGVRQLFRLPFEADFKALHMLPPAPPGQVHLDIGANRGQSIDAIRMLRPDAVIHAFEPNPMLAQRLDRTHQPGDQLIIHPCGLDDKHGQFDLHIPYYNGFMFDGLASFDREAAAGWLPRFLPGFDAAKQEIRTVTCTVLPLDALALAPCFIKIDVQGLELRVLRGSMSTIRRHQPALLIETPSMDIISLLGAAGYQRCAWTGRGFKRGCDGAINTFFLMDHHLTSDRN